MGNTPNIRFKGFTDDWEQRKLSEFVDKAVDNRGKTPPLDENGTHPLIEVSALGGVHPDYSKVEKYLNDNSFENNLRAYIKEGDILFTTVGSIGLVSLMDSREEAAIAQNIVAFRAKENFVPEYLYALFSNEENQYEAKRIVMGAVQPSIKVSQLVDVEYMLTENVKEQKKIGAFFSNLDNLITLHQRKCDETKELKKFMLQKMFPKNGEKKPEIRFEGFTDDWEQRKFSELYEKSSEKNDGSIDVERNITVATMQFKPDVTVSSEDYLKTYYTFNVGDIAFEGHHSKDFMFGRFVENDIGDGIVSHIFAVFRPIVDYDLYYWKYAIHNESIMRPILSKSTKASTMMHDLVTKDFLNESILVPSVDEQKRIGAYLNNLDSLITLHQRKCDEIKEIKKFMLQNMFPQKG